MLADGAASIPVSTFALYLWLFGKVAKYAGAWFDWPALASVLVTSLGNVIASLLSGESNLALISLFAMLPWVVAASLKQSW